MLFTLLPATHYTDCYQASVSSLPSAALSTSTSRSAARSSHLSHIHDYHLQAFLVPLLYHHSYILNLTIALHQSIYTLIPHLTSRCLVAHVVSFVLPHARINFLLRGHYLRCTSAVGHLDIHSVDVLIFKSIGEPMGSLNFWHSFHFTLWRIKLRLKNRTYNLPSDAARIL